MIGQKKKNIFKEYVHFPKKTCYTNGLFNLTDDDKAHAAKLTWIFKPRQVVGNLLFENMF